MIRNSLRYAEEVTEAVGKQLAQAYRAKDLLGFGLRQRLHEAPYAARDFRADLVAALVVAALGLPLAMALAISCGLPPQLGLSTAILGGIACALLGGSRFQVTGPTAAIVVVLVPVLTRFGLAGALVAGMLAGGILVLLGVARMGRLIQFVPHPVTSGFTMGIAVVLALLQLQHVLGVALPPTDGMWDYLAALWHARGAIEPGDAGVALVTLALLAAAPRIVRRVPAALVALPAAALVAVAAIHFAPAAWHLHIATIGSSFTYPLGGGELGHGLPPVPPLPVVPWHQGAGLALDYATLRALLPSAFAIAMLGGIESLSVAVVADGMSNTRHDPNAELIALGVANVVCPLFGGIAAGGALSRTATNIRAGARSPLAAALQGVILLVAAIALAPLLAYLPIASLAALVLVLARNIAEARHFVRLARIAPRSDVIVMLTCFGLTVAFDLVLAVTVGIVLAALLFMRRMAVLTRVALETPALDVEVPAGVRVYEIAGPLFFGAAKSAMEALHRVGDRDHTYIIHMARVPTMDATGLVAMESVLDRLHRSKIQVIFAGLSPDVNAMFERAGIKRQPGWIAYAPDLATAMSMAIVAAARVERGAPAAA